MQFEKLKSHLKEKQYTWFITGVAGFIGSNLLEELLSLNQKIIGVDNFASGYKRNIDDVLGKFPKAIAANFIFHEADICSLSACEKACKNVDYILHNAAFVSVPGSIDDPVLTHATNVTGFLNILNVAKNNDVKRVVFASSSAVYGDSIELPKVELQIGNPLSPYAASKLINEIYAKTFSVCYGLETIGLRYFNVFGPRQDPYGPYAAVVPLWVKSLLHNEPVYINGDGSTTRDFCYVANVVQANLLAAMVNNPAALNSVYNIAVGAQTSLLELFNAICLSLGKDCKPSYRPFRDGDIKHSLADINKAKQFLGYAATHGVERGLQEAMNWYQKNLS